MKNDLNVDLSIFYLTPLVQKVSYLNLIFLFKGVDQRFFYWPTLENTKLFWKAPQFILISQS